MMSVFDRLRLTGVSIECFGKSVFDKLRLTGVLGISVMVLEVYFQAD